MLLLPGRCQTQSACRPAPQRPAENAGDPMTTCPLQSIPASQRFPAGDLTGRYCLAFRASGATRITLPLPPRLSCISLKNSRLVSTVRRSAPEIVNWRTQGMDVVDNLAVTTADDLATHYAPPLERVLKKELDHVDALGRAFIAASPFLVLATGGKAGLDC